MLSVLTTGLSANEAGTLAEAIIGARLAACVQILPQMTSVYVWQGKLQKEGEHLLLIKTLPEKYPELEAFITANHSYDVPEIVAIETANVSRTYLEWMTQLLSGKRKVESGK